MDFRNEIINMIPVISEDPVKIEGHNIAIDISNELETNFKGELKFYLGLLINSKIKESYNIYIMMNSLDRVESGVLLSSFTLEKSNKIENYLANWEIELSSRKFDDEIEGNYNISVHMIPVRLEENRPSILANKDIDDELIFNISSNNYKQAEIEFFVRKKYKLKLV